MHIVYISREYPPSLRGGGIASYIRIMAEGFAARGHNVTVIAASDDTRQGADIKENGVRIIRLSGGDFFIKEVENDTNFFDKFRFISRFHSYRKRVRDVVLGLKDIDIIEVAEFGAEGLYINKLGIPVVYRLHTPSLLDHKNFSVCKLRMSNLLYYYGGKKELELLRKNAKHITSCSTSLKEWVGRNIGLDTSEIRVIYNPLQEDFLSQSRPLEFEKSTVFFAGTICDWKGVDDLIEACKLLNDAGKSVTLKMAGKMGEYGEELKNRNKGNSWLQILGKLPQNKLKEFYSSSGVVCFPSWWENMPMVCIEAMAQGAIVIGSNSGGMSEIIQDGVSGFLLPPQSPEIWARKIWEVLHLDISTRNKIASAARDRIRASFSLDSILNQTEENYNSIIQTK